MKNNKILILVNHDVVIYNFRIELVEKLLADGYEIHISSPIGTHTEELKSLGAFFHEVSFDRHGMNLWDEIRLINYYKHLMKRINPAMVFTYTIKCNVYGGMIARKLHIPFCANITGLGTAVNDGGIKGKVVLKLYKMGLKSAQRVFFQNIDNMKYMVNRGIVSSPYTVLPGSGVNLDRHNFEPYPISDKEIIISYIGRIMRDKGIDELLEAASVVRGQYPNVHIRLIGFFDDDYEDIIRKAVRQEIIEYVEQQSDIHPWISASHAVIMPSYHEGMSNVLLEAASTGRPVLASNIPGCRETFDDGITGICFEVQNSESIAKAIIKFVNLSYDEKKAMGSAGRKKMEKEFNRSIVVEKYMEELNGGL